MSPAVTYRFPKSSRLRSSREFEQVYGQQQRVADGVLLIFARARADEVSRIGLSVSRKRGNAVRRNREKRLLREAFRLEQHTLPRGWDWIAIPIAKRPLRLADVRRSLQKITAKFRRREDLPATENSSPESSSGSDTGLAGPSRSIPTTHRRGPRQPPGTDQTAKPAEPQG